MNNFQVDGPNHNGNFWVFGPGDERGRLFTSEEEAKHYAAEGNRRLSGE